MKFKDSSTNQEKKGFEKMMNYGKNQTNPRWHIVHLACLLILAFSVVSLAAIIDEPIYQDNFSNMDLAAKDPNLANDMAWQIVRGTVSSSQSTDGNCQMAPHQNNSLAVSEQAVDVPDYTISFDCNVTWSSPAGAILLYQDENNYYRMNLTGGPVTITRVMDGTPTAIGQCRDNRITLPHLGSSPGSYKIHIKQTDSEILFEIGRMDTSVDYDAKILETDKAAINKFKNGKVGFYENATSSPNLSRFKISNVSITKGKLNQQREAVTYFVDRNNGNDLAPGNENAPFKTINHATQLALAGDTILVKPGTYRESISFANNSGEDAPITLKAFDPNDRPIIDGSVLLEGFEGPDDRGIYSLPFTGAEGYIYQNGKKLPIAMQPNVKDPEDPYDHADWYPVEANDVAIPGSNEETEMLAAGVEYLKLNDDFKTVNGNPVPDDYWKGATLYHYYRPANTTNTREIIAYSSSNNTVTVPKGSRISAPNDYYAIADHPGVIDNPGEYAINESVLYLKPVNEMASGISIASLDYGISLTKRNITIDGTEICRFLKDGIIDSYYNHADNCKITNSYIHHNGASGISVRDSINTIIENSEFSYNNQNGISFSSGTGNIKLINNYVHHNNNNGIWLGSGVQSLYACKDILIKDCKVVFQGSSQSHPDNIQFHQVADLVLDGNYLEQTGHQNMWCQSSGRITFKNNVFVNGPIGFCQMSPAYIYNNVFDRSGLRFDAHQGSTGATLVKVSDIYSSGWDKIRDDIRSDITAYPNNLLWNRSLDLVNEIRGWPEGAKIEEAILKDSIIARINEVILDHDFYKNNISIYSKLDPKAAAKHIIDAVIERGIMDSQGNITTSFPEQLSEEITGVNRTILDEVILDGKVSKSVHNYRPHDVRIENNIIIESSIYSPPAELYLTPYFKVDHNYYNIENSWLFSSWNKLSGYGPNSIISRYQAKLAGIFINYAEHDYHLKPGVDLIDAGIDVGLPFEAEAPDIGRFESGLINVPTDANSIQSAVDSALDSDKIVVAPGVYYENINFNGKSIHLVSSNPDDASITATTIIDAGGEGSAVTFGPAENGETSTSILSGLTITGGNSVRGGGVYIDTASPIIENCIIKNNTAIEEGAGVYCMNSNATIRQNEITENTSEYGYGGGVFTEDSDACIANNIITSNSANFGAGVFSRHSTGDIANNTIAHNTSAYLWFALGITLELKEGQIPPAVKNNIVAFNDQGIGVGTIGRENLDWIVCNNFYNNSNGNYNPTTPDQTGQHGNISTDPFFLVLTAATSA